mgnify:CR=1 FL=1
MENLNQTPSLDLPQALQMAATKIVQFTGRSRRSEFWWTILIITIVEVIILPVILYIPLTGIFVAPLIGFLLELARLPLTFRRLHDTGRSGIWCVIDFLLPLVFVAMVLYDVSFYNAMEESSATFGAGYTSGEMSSLGYFLAVIYKYILLAIVCFVYKIVLIVFLCRDSDPYENDYGPSPKYIND